MRSGTNLFTIATTCLSALVTLTVAIYAAEASGDNAAPSAHPTKLAAQPAAHGTIRIGFVVSMSGLAGDPCKEVLEGADCYLSKIDHQMGGRKVELIVQNDLSNPETAVAKLKRLVEEAGVDMLDGFFLTPVAYAVAPHINEYQIPSVIATASGDDLTQRKRSKWIIRTSDSSSQASYPFGEWVHKNLGCKKIATIAADFPYSWEVVGGFQKSYEQAGGKIVQKIWTPMQTTDFTPYFKKLRPDIDAVFYNTVGPTTKIFPQQFKQSGIKAALIGGGSSFDESFLDEIGPDVAGAISTRAYSGALSTPANKEFAKEYLKHQGRRISWYSENGYTSMMWIDQAVKAVKGDVENKEAFMQALRNVRLPNAPRGPMELDKYGNVIENIYIRKVEKVGPHYQNSVIATYKDVSQFWKYPDEEYLKQPSFTKDYPPCTYCSE